jgi:hypothetical protein
VLSEININRPEANVDDARTHHRHICLVTASASVVGDRGLWAFGINIDREPVNPVRAAKAIVVLTSMEACDATVGQLYLRPFC